MRKSLLVIIALLWIPLSARPGAHHKYAKNKYSQTLDCEYPLNHDVPKYFRSADAEFDLEKYKSIIRNGDISLLEAYGLDDLQLGALNDTELKLLRNLFYAAKGYIFSDGDLSDYFSAFAWYEPKLKSVSLTTVEKVAIEKIKEFEAGSEIGYAHEGSDIVWEEFNGGQNQEHCILKLNGDGTFEYKPEGSKSRLKKVAGTWKIEDGKIALLAEKEHVLLGGFFADGPYPYLMNGTSAAVTYDVPLKILLPIKKGTAIFERNNEWLKIGSRLFYIREGSAQGAH